MTSRSKVRSANISGSGGTDISEIQLTSNLRNLCSDDTDLSVVKVFRNAEAVS